MRPVSASHFVNWRSNLQKCVFSHPNVSKCQQMWRHNLDRNLKKPSMCRFLLAQTVIMCMFLQTSSPEQLTRGFTHVFIDICNIECNSILIRDVGVFGCSFCIIPAGTRKYRFSYFCEKICYVETQKYFSYNRNLMLFRLRLVSAHDFDYPWSYQQKRDEISIFS